MAWGHTTAVACALVMAGGIALAGRLACAEILARRDTVSALVRAAELDRLAPVPAYFERLADLDPDRAHRWLDAALQANPRNTSARIARGLAEERSGSVPQAERDLLQAAFLDRQYLPAWTLAGFYFRQDRYFRPNRRAQFWTWARRAAALTYDDYRPLLALAHAIEPDPRAAIENLGGSENVSDRLISADLDYLAQESRLADSQEIAHLLIARKNPADKPRVLALAELQIQAGRARDALELWNAVSPPIRPEADALAGGDLLSAPSGVAFDWSLPQNDGVFSHWQRGQLTFSLSGTQPESCALLQQRVALDSSRRYRLRFEYRSDDLTDPTGLAWDLDGNSAPIPPAGNWRWGQSDLRVKTRQAGHLALAWLRLLYQRQPGRIRAAGKIQIRNLSLEAL